MAPMQSRSRRRVWCETVPPETLVAPATVALLRRYAVDPILAVWPSTVDAAREAAARFAGAGLRPALWPMLSDADGRWISAANAAAFCAFAERLVERLAERPAGPFEIVLDLEPPIEAVRATLASRGLARPPPLGAASPSTPPPSAPRTPPSPRSSRACTRGAPPSRRRSRSPSCSSPPGRRRSARPSTASPGTT